MEDGNRSRKAGEVESTKLTENQRKDMIIKDLRKKLSDNEDARVLMATEIGQLAVARRRQKEAEAERDRIAEKLMATEDTLRRTLDDNKELVSRAAERESILEKFVQHVEAFQTTLRKQSIVIDLADIAMDIHNKITKMISENFGNVDGAPGEPVQVPLATFRKQIEELLASGDKLLKKKAVIDLVSNTAKQVLLSVPIVQPTLVVRDAEAEARAAAQANLID